MQRLVFLLLAPVALAAEGGLSSETWGFWEQTLAVFVNQNGLVNYRALRADPGPLTRFLEGLDRARTQGLGRLELLELYLNAYNACTLHVVVENYPLRARGLLGFRYPANSIRQIPGVWSEPRCRVGGQLLSLDTIEHELLRPLGEPRIHMALVCAAKGCPPLRREPYRAALLEEQLDDQARRYLATPAGLRITAQGEVAVSAIFRWFAEDFRPMGGVRVFLTRYAPEQARRLLADPRVKLRFLDYDWSLNELEGSGTP